MLLLIPLEKKIDWKKRPPVVTLGLILLNILVFFFVQGDDEARWEAASTYYEASPLPALEFPPFLAHLDQSGDWEAASRVRALMQEPKENAAAVLMLLQQDKAFLARLHGGEIIRPDAAEHAEWVRSRTEFESLYGRIVVDRYALDPSRPETYLTSMFLHGGLDHLFGNMLFLFIAGFAVERIVGHARFFFSYLFGGLCSGLLWTLVHPESGAIGASGAISAVMGMYAILFGLRKIRFFYWVVVYFDYVRAPAWILLPLWLLNELYGVWRGGSGIAYFAHIGGFLGGGAAALLLKRIPGGVDTAYLDEGQQQETRARDHQRGMELLAALKFDQAKLVFEGLLARDPEDKEALRSLYGIVKLKPDSAAYHQTAGWILGLKDTDPATLAFMHETFKEYSKNAKPFMQIDLARLTRLATRFVHGGYLDEAERILLFLLKKAPQVAGVPDGLLALAEGFRRKGSQAKHAHYLRLVSTHYPDSEAARAARRRFSAAG